MELAELEHRHTYVYGLVENKILALYVTPTGGEGTHNDEEFSIAWKLTRTVFWKAC